MIKSLDKSVLEDVLHIDILLCYIDNWKLMIVWYGGGVG